MLWRRTSLARRMAFGTLVELKTFSSFSSSTLSSTMQYPNG